MAVPRPRESTKNRTERRPPPPLDAAALERLALRYVERFATTRAKLARYLDGKVRERGWSGEGPADPPALAERLAALGYVDDAAFATMKAGAMTRRGLGAARVRGTLHAAGVAEEDRVEAGAVVAEGRVAAAVAFARRKRLGPFGAPPADRPARERQLAALVRAGHDFALARAIVALGPEDDIDQALAPFGLDADPC